MSKPVYYYTYSTPKDRGVQLPQTRAQQARSACPIGASLYRREVCGMWTYLGYRRDVQSFARVK